MLDNVGEGMVDNIDRLLLRLTTYSRHELRYGMVTTTAYER
jgi:hypothetical protein